eukprot:732057-Pyramimonas_sp.AAC.1
MCLSWPEVGAFVYASVSLPQQGLYGTTSEGYQATFQLHQNVLLQFSRAAVLMRQKYSISDVVVCADANFEVQPHVETDRL